MSPQLYFAGEVIQPARLVRNGGDGRGTDRGGRTLLFFSGGVDAWSSLVTHLQEKPMLFSVWGADIPWENETAWGVVEKRNREDARRFGLEFCTARSNLRSFTDETALDKWSYENVGDNWWSAFQHSLGMFCLAAPLTREGLDTVYFGSTYCLRDGKGEYIIASDPSIDNYVRFAGAAVVHDGYEYSRLEKVSRICGFAEELDMPVALRVCFRSLQGENCCTCEKCANTVMAILVSGHRPEEFGFAYNRDTLPRDFAAGLQEMAREEKYAFKSLYRDMQPAMRTWYAGKNVPKELRLFLESNLDELADFLHVPCGKCGTKDELISWLREEMKGKEWLDKEYHSLWDKVHELEAECQRRGEWIAKLEEDKRWLWEKQNTPESAADRIRKKLKMGKREK